MIESCFLLSLVWLISLLYFGHFINIATLKFWILSSLKRKKENNLTSSLSFGKAFVFNVYFFFFFFVECGFGILLEVPKSALDLNSSEPNTCILSN